MYDFVRRQNIERLKKQLAEEHDPAKRKLIQDLLAEAERGDPIPHARPPGEG
jgi:hypothetical protein